MATCPRCHHYLGTDHRCRRWPMARRAAWRILAGVVGGILGLAIGANLGPPYDVFGLLIGAVAGMRLGPRRRR